jgi:hypothetical protein
MGPELQSGLQTGHEDSEMTEQLQTPFEKIEAPDCGIQLIYDRESLSLNLGFMPKSLDRISMYALIEAAKKRQPIKVSGYLPPIRTEVQVGISVVRRNGQLEYAVAPETEDFLLDGLLALAGEIVLGKRPMPKMRVPTGFPNMPPGGMRL